MPDRLAAGAGSVIGRFVRYNTGAVQLLTAPFIIGSSGLLTSSAPGVAYSSASNEFLVAWTDGLNNIRGQRVDASGAKVGAMIPIAMTSLWEGFPTLTYNSAQDEYLRRLLLRDVHRRQQRGHAARETRDGRPDRRPLDALQRRLQPVSRGRVQFSDQSVSRYLVGVQRRGVDAQRPDGRRQRAAAWRRVLALAAKGGGDGVGLGYNPVSNTYLRGLPEPDEQLKRGASKSARRERLARRNSFGDRDGPVGAAEDRGEHAATTSG